MIEYAIDDFDWKFMKRQKRASSSLK